MFCGFIEHGDEEFGIVQCVNLNRIPTAPSGTVTFKVYSPSGNLIEEGTAAAFDEANLTAAFKWVVDTGSNNYERGGVYVVYATYTVGGFSRVEWFTFIVS